MIQLKVNDKEYSIKTEWGELTYNEFVKRHSCKDKPLNEKISAYSGLPLDLVSKLSLEQVSFICDAVCFLEEPDNIGIFAKPFTGELNIGKRKYKEFEQSLIFIRKVSSPVLALDKIVKIYFDEEIGEQNLLECYGKGVFILDLISKFLNEFKRLGEYEPSVEEMEAGVDELSKFGFFGTSVQLARKYGQTHDEILDMPCREVYTTLLYDFEQSEVEKRLNQIRSRKK